MSLLDSENVDYNSIPKEGGIPITSTTPSTAQPTGTTRAHKPAPMVAWYNPAQLGRTALDVLISTIFGRHSDYRLVEALSSPTIQPIDLSQFQDLERKYPNDEEFWIDYVADLGDGWNSTYAVARTLAQPALPLEDSKGDQQDTRRGRLLVFGGDMVYPVANREAYERRLVSPYETALRKTGAPHPVLVAIPGNHDWYDSLVAFTRLFCSKPWFAGWQTRQDRSYFAVKLPRHWWLIGVDMQLNSDIDRPQVAYFEQIRKKMGTEDRIILCCAEPHWVSAKIYSKIDPNYNENNLRFLEEKIFSRRQIAVFIAGDLHHYRRHYSKDGVQKITAGGGGAFLHPTHGPDVSTLSGGFREAEKCFPSKKVSRRLGRRNLLFPFYNPRFGLVTAVLYLLTAWAVSEQMGLFNIQEIGRLTSFRQAVAAALHSTLASSTGFLWAVLVLAGFWLFTDTHSRWYRLVAGFIHSVSHLAALFFIAWGAAYFTIGYLGYEPKSFEHLLTSALIIVPLGYLAGSWIMGIYLWISINRFGRHANEAFSSLHIADWKSFVRFRIDMEGNLTIFPIGIQRVRAELPQTAPEKDPEDPRATAPELIEDPINVG